MNTNTTNSDRATATSETVQFAESCAVCTMALRAHTQQDLAFCIQFSFFGERAEDEFQCVRCNKQGNLPTMFRHSKTLYRQIKTHVQSITPPGTNQEAATQWRESQLAFMQRRVETSTTYPKQVQIVQTEVRDGIYSSPTEYFTCRICKKLGKKASTRRLARMVDHIKLHFRRRALVAVKTGNGPPNYTITTEPEPTDDNASTSWENSSKN